MTQTTSLRVTYIAGEIISPLLPAWLVAPLNDSYIPLLSLWERKN